MIDLWKGALSRWKSIFSSSFVAVFWWILPSNTPIILYNIFYWWFFLSQGNRWTKYLAHPKIQRPKPCLLMFASLVALDSFHLLLSTQLIADFDSGVKWWIHVSSIVTYLCKNSFLLQTMLRIIDVLLFLIHCKQMWHPLGTQISHWQMFIQNGEYTAFWYLQLLCYLMHLQLTIGQNKFVEFFGVFQNNCRIWVTWAVSIIWVCTTASIPPLKCCFWWSRVRITLIKTLLCLNSIFSTSESNTLSTHEIQIFPLFWKFATVLHLNHCNCNNPTGFKFWHRPFED